MKHTLKLVKYSFLSVVFTAIALMFVAGYLIAKNHRSDFYTESVTTTATIESIEGSFLRGRKVKEIHYNYWVVFDGHRFHYQWPEQYGVGEVFEVAYRPERPSEMKPLSRMNKNREGEWKVAAMFLVGFPLIFGALAYWNIREFLYFYKARHG